MSTHLLNAGKAAWVSEAASGTTYNDRPTLALDGTGADEKRAFIWFPNPVGRLGDSVLSATLTVYLSNTWAGTNTITVKRVTASWKQDTVKWGASGANPTVTATNAATATVTDGVAGDAVPIDVSSILGDVAAGGAWYGLRIEIDTTGPLRLHSPDSATPRYRPTLLVDMSTAPDAPDGLKPDGTAYADSESPPSFHWQFNTSDAVAYQTQSRVQVSDTEGSYTTPVYDSDWESNDQTSWDPSDGSVAVPALEEATTYYWRVAVRDQNGLESDWSDEATFVWRNAGDVQIIDPMGDGEPVYDSTPTITWYTNNLDQRSVRIKVWTADANGDADELLYTREWSKQEQDLNDDSEDVGYDTFTIPSTVPSFRGDGDPIISTPTQDYLVEVAVRDAYNRRDDDYVSDTRLFSFELGSSIAAPTGFTATNTTGTPHVALEWTHASSPNKFVVYRSGVAIAELDADEVLVSGNDYAWTDYTAEPGTAYTYEVCAKNDGVEIGLAPTAAAVTTAPVGVWLVDPAGETLIPLLGNSDIAGALAETSVSLAPIGRRDPVRIVSRIGGYEGSAAGTIAEWNGSSAATHLSNLETLVGTKSTRKLRLVFGARNIAVNIGGLTVSQNPTLRGTAAQFDVSFNWWQVGNYSVSVN